MKKVLVLGGNHYFGKKLVEVLLKNSHDVTLLNRGSRDDGFGNKVKRIVCDRHNKTALAKAITTDYDIVFDQSCFDYDQAKMACDVFNGRVGKYIFTSSISAYNEYGSAIKESQLDPYSYKFKIKEKMEGNYGEAKRQAEVSFCKYAEFPVTAVRFPIVLDAYDATERLQFHVNRIKRNEPIFFANINALISFVSADDAASTLYELSQMNFSGPINVSSYKPIRLENCMKIIEGIVGSKMIRAKEKDKQNMSQYGIAEDWYIDCSKLESLGLSLEPVESFLPVMVNLINDSYKK